ncbi:MAG: FAD-binding oxidoreductase [Pseudomonadota bacterium]
MAGSLAGLQDALPAGRVDTDPALCAQRSEDVSGTGTAVSAVIRPETAQEVATAIAAARAAGFAILPRGGGMSYSRGYLAEDPGALSLDLTGLDRVLEIDAAGRCVTVEAGVTWAALDAALAGTGLRTPYFGPLSGLAATIGGTLSQNGAFFGATAHGYAADATLGLEIADGCGVLHRIGAWGARRDRALPRFGPDLLGPFLGDCGALGIKTKAVLRLIPRPPAPLFASFAFDSDKGVLDAMLALRDIPHLAELWAFDREAHRNLARSGFSVLEAAGMAADLAGGAGSVLGAMRTLASAATMRRAVLSDLPWSLHAVIEPPLAELQPALAEAVKAAATAAGGRPIPDTLPRVTRARPFRSIKALIGPNGERWLPCHGVFPAGRAADGLAAIRAICPEPSEDMRVSLLLAAVGDEVIVEPQLFWVDALSGFQRSYAAPAQSAPHLAAGARPELRASALALRKDLVAAMATAGAAHLQIGRSYRYGSDLDPGMATVMKALKTALDPDTVLNPGVLGLRSDP